MAMERDQGAESQKAGNPGSQSWIMGTATQYGVVGAPGAKILKAADAGLCPICCGIVGSKFR